MCIYIWGYSTLCLRLIRRSNQYIGDTYWALLPSSSVQYTGPGYTHHGPSSSLELPFIVFVYIVCINACVCACVIVHTKPPMYVCVYCMCNIGASYPTMPCSAKPHSTNHNQPTYSHPSRSRPVRPLPSHVHLSHTSTFCGSSGVVENRIERIE